MSKARNLSDFISDPTISSTEIADQAVTHPKLHGTMDLSSKTVTLPTLSTLNTTGNVLVGTIDTNVANNSGSGNDGVNIHPDSIRIARTDGDMLLLNRLNSDGDIIKFLKDGAAAGSIGVASEYLYINGTRTTDAGLMFGTQVVAPASSTGANRNNAIDLGFPGNSFKDLHLSGGVNYASGTLNYTGTSVPTGANNQGLYVPSYAIGLGGTYASLNFPTTSGAPTTTAWWMLGRAGGSNDQFTLRVRRGGTAAADQTAYVVTTSGADSAKIVDSHKWYTGGSNGTERMRIDGSGHLLVGKSATGIGTVGAELKATGELLATVNNDACAFLNRKSSDGAIINFRKDGTTVGSIQTRGSAVSTFVLDPRTNGVGITGTSNAILPTTNTGAITSTAVDLGAPGYEYRNLYLSGNVTSTGMSTFSDITIGKVSDGQALIQMIANPTNGANTIHFGDATSGGASYDGYIQYAHDSRTMQFGVGGAEAMRIIRDDGTNDGLIKVKGGIGLNFSSSFGDSQVVVAVGTDNSYRSGVIFELQTSQSLWASGFVKIKCAAGRNGLESRSAAEYLYRFQAHNESISGIALVSSAGNTGDFTISVTEANANSSAGTVELKVKSSAATNHGTSVTYVECGHYNGITRVRRGI